MTVVRLGLLSAALSICALADPEISSELIFPQEKWHNHSSSIVELPNGDLLVCWFHGSGERPSDDVLIQAARWNHVSRKWSAPFLMADTPGFPDTNPTMFIDSRKRLFLLWPAIIANQWETALMKYRISENYQQDDRSSGMEVSGQHSADPQGYRGSNEGGIRKRSARFWTGCEVCGRLDRQGGR